MLVDDISETTEQSSSKSASNTPRSITPAVQYQDEDEGLVLNVPSAQDTPNHNTDIESNPSSSLKDEIITSLQTE
ncbi:unnamed protein product, partial [Adineta steineri]